MRTLNDQGFRGRDVGLAGALGAVFAGTAAIVSAYEGYIRDEPVRRDAVIVTPVVGPRAGGAVASWSW